MCFQKREGGSLEGDNKGSTNGEHSWEVGGQGIQTEVQASYQSPLALG